MDNHWKIRQLSLELLSDYIGQVFAIEREKDDDGESGLKVFSDCPSSEEFKTLLPIPSVNKMISAIFLGRFDNHGQIKTMSFGFWRGIASHPVRAVSEAIFFIVEDLCKCFGMKQEMEYDHFSGSDIAIETLIDLGGDRMESVYAVISEITRRMLEKALLPMVKSLFEKVSTQADTVKPLAILSLLIYCLKEQIGEFNHQEKLLILTEFTPQVREILLFDSRDHNETSLSIHAFAFGLLLDLIERIGGSTESLESFVANIVEGRKERFDVLWPLVRARPSLLTPVLLKSITAPGLESIDIKDIKLKKLFINAADDLMPICPPPPKRSWRIAFQMLR